MSFPRRAAAVAVLGLSAALLAACSPTIALEPAPDANNPLCANVMVNLPKSLAANDPSTSLKRVWTDAQSTAAWGDPVSVYFSCGVDVPAASLLPCQSHQGFDWLIDDTDAPFYRMTVFGREPAIQVYFNSEIISSVEVLSRIGKAAQDLPLTGSCTERPTS